VLPPRRVVVDVPLVVEVTSGCVVVVVEDGVRVLLEGVASVGLARTVLIVDLVVIID
jgi:hypothetical protein